MLQETWPKRSEDLTWLARLGPWKIAGLFGLTIVILMLAVDVPVSRLMRGANPGLVDFFRLLADVGNSKWYLVPLAILIPACLVLRANRRTQKVAQLYGWAAGGLLFVFVAIAGSGLITDLIKVLAGRARPKLLNASDIYGFFPPGLNADFQSFPSGHANTMFALMIALALFWPRARNGFLLIAALGSISRVVVNAHYLSDVITGAALAVLTTLWLRDFFARHRIAFELNGLGRARLQAPGRLLRMRLRGWLTGLF